MCENFRLMKELVYVFGIRMLSNRRAQFIFLLDCVRHVSVLEQVHKRFDAYCCSSTQWRTSAVVLFGRGYSVDFGFRTVIMVPGVSGFASNHPTTTSEQRISVMRGLIDVTMHDDNSITFNL